MNHQIPKIIHYCWFGGKPFTPLVEKCVRSWEKHLPGYDIKRWDESVFDVTQNWFTQKAYQAKKYAFVSDYVRLHALKTYGGVYLDTDQELLKPLDSFLDDGLFCGFQDENFVSAGVLGAYPKSAWMDELLRLYAKTDKKKLFSVPNTVLLTTWMQNKGLVLNNTEQRIEGIKVYPQNIFCPKGYDDVSFTVDEKTAGIHHFAMSWLPAHKRVILNIKRNVLKKYTPSLVPSLHKLYKKVF